MKGIQSYIIPQRCLFWQFDFGAAVGICGACVRCIKKNVNSFNAFVLFSMRFRFKIKNNANNA